MADCTLLDMYREVIEHPLSLPAVLKRQLDLTSGDDRGRLYRIVPADYQYTPPKLLAKASTAELVDALDDANQWRRTTALRLIYERQDPAAGKLLHAQLAETQRPEGRIAVLYALDSVHALEDADLLQALGDAHPQVRRHAVRLSESRLDKSAALRDKVVALVSDCRSGRAIPTRAFAGRVPRHGGDAGAGIDSGSLIEESRYRGCRPHVDRRPCRNCFGIGSRPTTNGPPARVANRSWARSWAKSLGNGVPMISTRWSNCCASPMAKRQAASAAALLKALSRLPSDALSGNDPPQLATLRELQQTAAKAIVARGRASA